MLPKIVELMRERPALYLGGKLIVKFKAFLDGYYCCMSSTSKESEDYKDDMLFWSEFQIWIENKYGLNTTHSWASIINILAPDEASALELFFKLADKFDRHREERAESL